MNWCSARRSRPRALIFGKACEMSLEPGERLRDYGRALAAAPLPDHRTFAHRLAVSSSTGPLHADLVQAHGQSGAGAAIEICMSARHPRLPAQRWHRFGPRAPSLVVAQRQSNHVILSQPFTVISSSTYSRRNLAQLATRRRASAASGRDRNRPPRRDSPRGKSQNADKRAASGPGCNGR
jgi:hypothetical protein